MPSPAAVRPSPPARPLRASIATGTDGGVLAAFGLAVGLAADDDADACAAEEVPRRGSTGAYFQGELVALGLAVSSATTPAVVLYIQGPLVARSFAVGLPLMMPYIST